LIGVHPLLRTIDAQEETTKSALLGHAMTADEEKRTLMTDALAVHEVLLQKRTPVAASLAGAPRPTTVAKTALSLAPVLVLAEVSGTATARLAVVVVAVDPAAPRGSTAGHRVVVADAKTAATGTSGPMIGDLAETIGTSAAKTTTIATMATEKVEPGCKSRIATYPAERPCRTTETAARSVTAVEIAIAGGVIERAREVAVVIGVAAGAALVAVRSGITTKTAREKVGNRPSTNIVGEVTRRFSLR
jgi:hypothetical protein